VSDVKRSDRTWGKWLPIAMICLFLGLLLSGCLVDASESKESDQGDLLIEDKPSDIVDNPDAVTNPGYSIVEKVDILGPVMQEDITTYLHQQGFKTHFDGTEDVTTCLIFMGEQMTGGYAIEMVGADVVGQEVTLTIQEMIPGTDEMVTQALTYPYLVVQLDGEYTSVTVKNTQGDLYEELG